MNNHIPHYLIESFLMAAEETSFQIAADKLGITQSTLSKQMIMLEELLPHKIFTFDGRKKVLTMYGKALLESLKPKFSQTQELIEQTSLLFASSENLQVRISGRGELLDMLATQLTSAGKLIFMPLDNQSAIDSILSRQAEIAIVHSGVNSLDLVMKPFLHNNFKFVISKSLTKTKPKSEEDLIELLTSKPGLLYKPKDSVVENLMKSWKIKSEDLRISRVYPNYTTLARMVNEGLGWAIVPSHTMINEDKNYTFPISAQSQFHRKFYLLYRKDLTTAVWMRELLSDIKELSSF